MLKKILLLLLIVISIMGFSQQENTRFINQHLVRADISILAGNLFMENINNVYLGGNAEYYFDNKFSVRGSACYLIGSDGLTKDSMGIKDLHSILVGGAYHFTTKSYFDPYLIFQPGLTFARSYRGYQNLSGEFLEKETYKGSMDPIATMGLGFNYYFQRFAHLFFETRYIYGRHLSSAPSPINLQELRVTFGLGFNLFLMKNKKSS